ncbi:hypothetical protein LQF12_04505 [Ruania suaedae]|uniref:hypothetical protein n=1 Tax=Ruania suaedae TaxID=2897774 RepID=UPI001E5985C5|nr:hypothetical protein [Ruania suaedae]UFU03876.1 hypothetical protein LQF12_04505 [Ruania suaedae]
MRAIEVDERDSRWESGTPRYRIVLFEGPAATVRAVDLLEASLAEAEEAAQDLAEGEALWSLALVVEDTSAGRGLVWLIGGDYHDHPCTPRAWRQRGEMQDRYLAARNRNGLPVTLPDGRRVIRLFPEWGVDWPLWESFTEKYTLTAADLGLSPGLAGDLHAWNARWQHRNPEDDRPTPDEWTHAGHHLHARLQEELAAVAEVRPEFE